MQHLTQPDYDIGRFDKDHPLIKAVAVQVNGSAENQHRIEIRTLQIFNAYQGIYGDDTVISLDNVPNVKSQDGVFAEFVKHIGLDPENLLTDEEYESDSRDVAESVDEHLGKSK